MADCCVTEEGSNRSLLSLTARESRSTTGVCGRDKLKFKVVDLRPRVCLLPPGRQSVTANPHLAIWGYAARLRISA